jgi:2-oxoisovalerate dehydrogenase E1 component
MADEKYFPGQLEIIDLRSLFPLDEDMIFESVKKHGKCLVRSTLYPKTDI